MNKEELLFDDIYNQTQDFGRTQFVREIVKLQQKVNQLETNRDEAIKLMRKKSKLVKKKELCHFAFYNMQMDDVSEVLEILERGKE